MSVVRICFLGTPEFAAVHLRSLIRDEHYQIVGVITQPDRPAGRNMKLTPSPVKVVAQENGIEILTPEKVSIDAAAIEKIKSWNAEIAVVVAYGQLLKQNILDLFRLGAVNVHGSLLPKYRGAAPIQRSLEAGDTVTGLALQRMVLKLDAGPVIAERKIELDDQINSIELYETMSKIGCELLNVELMDYIRGNLVPIEQDESKVTIAKKISKDESKLDLKLSARTLHNKVRGFAIGPGTHVMLRSKNAEMSPKRVKILRTYFVDSAEPASPQKIGQVVEINEKNIVIQCGHGLLSVFELQLEGKPRQAAAVFAQSLKLNIGDHFE